MDNSTQQDRLYSCTTLVRCRCFALSQGGSGQALDWKQLRPPVGQSKRGWLLAGGLQQGNVATAAALAKPTGVDVSSGVCGPDGTCASFVQIYDSCHGKESCVLC